MEFKEKKTPKRWRRIIALFFLGIFIAAGLIILFISPIAKYLVEKYDVKYTGREIKIGTSYVNPFTGYVRFGDVKIYEYKSDTVFISASSIGANFSMSKLLVKTYEIESLTLNELKGTIINNKKVFNFADLIDKFTPKEKATKKKEPVHFNLLDIEINNGVFYYFEPQVPIHYSVKKVNLKSPGLRWDTDSINGKLSLVAGVGTGNLSLDIMINTKNQDYAFSVSLKKLNADIINQYLNDFSNYGILSAHLDIDMKGKGNFKNEKNINTKGKMVITDLHYGKNPQEDYLSFKKLTVDITEMAPANKKFFFDSVMLEHPYFKYEKYDHLDNIETMFGKNESNIKAVSNDPEKFNLVIEISKYTQRIFKDFLQSDYKVNNLLVENGDVRFNDYSISEEFSAALNPLLIKADSVDNQKRWVTISLNSGIKPYGNISLSTSMNPANDADFKLDYKLKNIPVTAFNPYLITYTSFPLDRGFIDVFGQWNVQDDKIKSTNHFLAIDPRTTKRIKKKDTKWIPIPLIFAFIRDRGNVIDYEIPITGDLKNPKFHIKDIVLHTIENIFVKPPTVPYRIEIRNDETEVEKSLSLTWAMRQNKFEPSQKKYVDKIADFLKDNTEANIIIQPLPFTGKEKEYILFFESKKKYFFTHNNRQEKSMTEKDSLAIDKMSIKDSCFVKYLTSNEKDTLLFTIQEKCYKYIGTNLVDEKFKQLEKERANEFISCFKENETEKQIHFYAAKDTVPFNGFSVFKINYKGDIPASLKDAFEKLREINSEPPRDKYSKFRLADK